MKKIYLITFLFALAMVQANAQFLFRISGRGMEKPSYMLGTIHTMQGSVLDYTPEYTEVEARCTQFYTEYDITDQRRMKELNDAIEQTKASFKLPEGNNILDVLSKEQIEEVDVRVKKIFGQKLSDSIMVGLWNFQPYILSFLISNKIKSEAKRHGPRPNRMSAPIDQTCIFRAKLKNMRVGQLDELEDRLKVQGFQPISIDVQVDSLMSLVRNYDQRLQSAIKELEVLKQSTIYWCLADFKHFAAMDYWQAELRNNPAVFRHRNERWLPKMEDAMKNAPTMFVFGAGHLLGNQGIIQILRNSGYQVEQVKKK